MFLNYVEQKVIELQGENRCSIALAFIANVLLPTLELITRVTLYYKYKPHPHNHTCVSNWYRYKPVQVSVYGTNTGNAVFCCKAKPTAHKVIVIREKVLGCATE